MRQSQLRGVFVAASAGLGLGLAVLVQWCLAGTAFAAPLDRPRPSTVVPGSTVLTNTTWTVAGSPYLVQGPVYVGAGYTLTIQPGVTVQFTTAAWMQVQGGATLLAEGTPTQPITFMGQSASPQPGDWVRLEFWHNARGRLAYCDIGYGGAGGSPSTAVAIITAGQVPDVSLLHCRIHDHRNDGLQVIGDVDMQLVLEDTRFDHNGLAGLRVLNPRATPDYRNLTFDNNGLNGLVYDGAQSRGQFWQDLTLDGPALNGSPIVLANGTFNVQSGVSVTVKPGTEIRFVRGVAASPQFTVLGGGSLIAEGTPANPITFTSGMTIPQPADWGGFVFYPVSYARLAHCDISYAGNAVAPPAAVQIQSNDIHLRRCRIHHNQGRAIYTIAAAPTLLFNRIEDGTYGVYNFNPPTVVDARGNWWGHPSGPQHPSLNPGGQGVTVTNGVLFDPWLNDATAATLIVWPDRGGNTGWVTVNLAAGQDLPPTTVVKLTRAGQADIVGVVEPPDHPGDPLQVTFNLDGAALGAWNVSADDGVTAAVLPDGFTVEPGEDPAFYYSLQHRPAVMLGRLAEVLLLFGNTANVDAPPVHLRVTVPVSLPIMARPPVPHLLTKSDSDQAHFIDLYVARVPARARIAIPFRLLAGVVGDFSLGVRASGAGLTSQPEDPSLALSVTALVTTTQAVSATVHLGGDSATGDIVLNLAAEPTSNLLAEPLITRTVIGDLVRYEIVATVPDSAVGQLRPGLATGEGTQFSSVVETTNQVQDGLETIGDAYDEANAAADKVVSQAELIDCLFDLGVLDNTDLTTLTNLNEGAAVVKGVKVAADSVGGNTTLELFDGVLGDAVEMKLWNMARTGQLLDQDILPGTRQEVMDQLAQRCGGDRKNQPIKVRTSLDPNDKAGETGAGDARYLTGAEPLGYTVYFENVVTASLPAHVVVITDVLDADLDWSTLRFGPMTFGEHTVPAPADGLPFLAEVDLRPGRDLIVRAGAAFDANTGVITWQFTSLDPATLSLPDDPYNGFLPPNTDGSGQGSVFFTVAPKAGLAAGTEIRNQASIVFDVNAAILTPEWVNTIDASLPESAVAALPAAVNGPSFAVNWAGTDTGSGVADYTVYVSRNGGPFVPWLHHTPAASALYRARVPGVYAFYTLARDGAGNVEPPPAEAEAVTQVTMPSLYLPLIQR